MFPQQYKMYVLSLECSPDNKRAPETGNVPMRKAKPTCSDKTSGDKKSEKWLQLRPLTCDGCPWAPPRQRVPQTPGSSSLNV